MKKSIKNDFICDICGIAKPTRQRICVHVESHLNLRCDVCKASYRTKHKLKLHLRTHFENFVCHQCGLTFSNVIHFAKHVARHDPKPVEKRTIKKATGKFPCGSCPMVFDLSSSLASHEGRIHKSGKQPFKCSVCQREFHSREDFRLHTFDHYAGKVRFCDFPSCNKFFMKGKLLTNHKRCHFPPQFECSSCQKKFVQRAGLHKHRKGRCEYQKKLKAEPSGEEVERNAEVAKAQFSLLGGKLAVLVMPKELKVKEVKGNRKKNEKIQFEKFSDGSETSDLESSPEKSETDHAFVAVDIKLEPEEEWSYEYLDECNETLPAVPLLMLQRLTPEEILRWTKRRETSVQVEDQPKEEFDGARKPRKIYNDGKKRAKKKARKIRCTINSCNTEFPNLQLLHQHKRFDHGTSLQHSKKKSVVPYTCDLCGNEYFSWVAIATHLKFVHKPFADIACDFCEKSFKSQGNHKRHVRQMHSKSFDERKFVCHICARSFKENYHLVGHLRTHEEPRECRLCGKVVSNMKDHLFRHSKPPVPVLLPCPICGRLFDKFVLQTHIDRVHAKAFNGKIYRCEECAKDFTRKEDLRRHNYENHFDGLVHKCPKCDQIFRSKKALTAHRFAHNPLNVTCELCGRTYARRGALLKHKRLSHSRFVDIPKLKQEEVVLDSQ